MEETNNFIKRYQGDVAVIGISTKSNCKLDNIIPNNFQDFDNSKELDKSFFGNDNESLNFQEKVLLQCCYETFEDAQINQNDLKGGSNVSVFIYNDGNDSLSNVVSNYFNFNGTLETLNSQNSSMNVVNNGLKLIQTGICNYSIVGILSLNNDIQYVSVILLKHLSLAIQDNDAIYCIIKSSNEYNHQFQKNNIIFQDNNQVLQFDQTNEKLNDFLLFTKSCLLVNNNDEKSIDLITMNSLGQKINIFKLSNSKSINYNENESRNENDTVSGNQQFFIPFSANSIHSLKKYQSLLQNDQENKYEQSIKFDELVQHQINSKSLNFNHKSVSIAGDWKEFKKSLNCIESSNVKTSKPTVVCVFVGQGPQWNKMGLDLYSNFEVFKKSVDSLDGKMFKYFGFSIFEKLRSIKDDDMVSIHDPLIVPAALFIFNVSLFNLYKDWGVEPSILVGHSFGEDSSFYCSGAVDLDSICSVIYHRSVALQKMIGKGKMFVINISEEEYKLNYQDKYPSLEISCLNSENSIVVSGNEQDIKVLESEIKEKGIFCSIMGTNVPYHTNILNLIKRDILSKCNTIKHQQPNTPLFSTFSSNIYNDLKQPYDSNYVYESVSSPVLFEKTISNIYKYIESNGSSDNVVFLEVSAHPTLSYYLKEMITTNKINKKSVSIYSPINKKKNDEKEFQNTIVNLFVNNNVKIDFNCQFKSKSLNYKLNTRILPHYQWNNENIQDSSFVENDHSNNDGKDVLSLFKESVLSKISKLLSINESLIDVNKRLINYGADSLKIVQLKNWVDKQLGFKNIVTIQQLQTNSILNSIELIEKRFKDLSSGEVIIQRTPEQQKQFWLNEMKLDESIKALPIKNEIEKRVFITGITGFLGAYMLVHLLKMEQCPIVYCLLRNKSGSPNPINEIIGNLKHHKVYDQLNQNQIEKIVPMVGDLAKARLGLSNENYNIVSKNANLIINSGADLNLESDYQSNKPVNVDGILEIINLSISSEFQIPIVNFSTFTVFINQSFNGEAFDESIMPSLENIDNLPAGYMQSKVVGEYILMEAAKRGIPSMLIRPPSIFSHPESGVGLSSDFFQLSVQCCYATGFYPNVEMKCLLTPVDWMSDNIMNLILTDRCWSKSLDNEMNVYNVYGDIVSQIEIYEPLERLYNCKPIEFEKWRQMILDSNIESCIKFRSFHSMDFHLKHNIDSGLNISQNTKQLLKSLGSYNENWRINDKMISSHINYIFNNNNNK